MQLYLSKEVTLDTVYSTFSAIYNRHAKATNKKHSPTTVANKNDSEQQTCIKILKNSHSESIYINRSHQPALDSKEMSAEALASKKTIVATVEAIVAQCFELSKTIDAKIDESTERIRKLGKL